ncbi:tripartite tricarboxylate transporter substrate binding protein [Pigmentiphaga sp.]|uniref:Bug family tripartite tricarboxylate transporter substrate binding protein n=1 Tax=Pigmentiphaga sp. TaxID=1977564 RepID=UPI00128E2368|nr:tripartite tricarboxylate transporter substrate binding protein [Pigmentiphaga sp.]MPS28425.1 tripartite tricarboxylate transporter substrate binding protein [Alcaligenaceae bacterium SAGV5]MPS52090.1 tripartite tricarboxylate transporter substrate binding protein [Alcaligenaceae bacterium SAGV3]MPT56246.1 tripartite tricarboxylate transporter substrate binding protein [Alcaligenaceae bacterium]
MKKKSRNFRTALPRAACLALMAYAAAAPAADGYPSRPISLVVQAAPGGSSDITARVLAQKLSLAMNTQVIVINEPSAGGIVAMQRVKRAEPDGYTLMILGTKAAIGDAIFAAKNIDVLRDFEPVAQISTGQVAVVVKRDSPLKTMEDLIRDIKAKPGRVTVATGDVAGGIQYLGAALVREELKGDFVIVPYGTAAKLTTAVRAGEVDAAFELVPGIVGSLRDGEARALAVSGTNQLQDLPGMKGVPTMKEVGLPASDVTTSTFVVVPAGTPAGIVKTLNAEILRALAQPDLQQASRSRGSGIPDPYSAEETRTQLAREIARWQGIVKQANVKSQ